VVEITAADYAVESITPGHIVLRVGDRRIKLYGEALVRIPGQPDYVIFRNSITNWLSPTNEPVSPSDARLIEDLLRQWAKQQNISLDFE
jgi:hypothetical protein